MYTIRKGLPFYRILFAYLPSKCASSAFCCYFCCLQDALYSNRFQVIASALCFLFAFPFIARNYANRYLNYLFSVPGPCSQAQTQYKLPILPLWQNWIDFPWLDLSLSTMKSRYNIGPRAEIDWNTLRTVLFCCLAKGSTSSSISATSCKHSR